jgi:hypothetical protein
VQQVDTPSQIGQGFYAQSHADVEDCSGLGVVTQAHLEQCEEYASLESMQLTEQLILSLAYSGLFRLVIHRGSISTIHRASPCEDHALIKGLTALRMDVKAFLPDRSSALSTLA